jgi:hypothetical protein
MSELSTNAQGFLREFKASLHAALKDDYTLPSAKKIAYKNAGSVYPDVYDAYRHAITQASNGGATMVHPKSIGAVDPMAAEIFNEIRTFMQGVHYEKPTTATRRLMSPRRTAKPKVVLPPPPPVQLELPAPDPVPTLVATDIMAYPHDTIRLNLINWAMTADYGDIVAVLQLTRAGK